MSEPQIPAPVSEEAKDPNIPPVDQNSQQRMPPNSEPTMPQTKALWPRIRRHLNWPLILKILAIKGLIFIFAVQSYPVLTRKPIKAGRGWLEIWNHWDSLRYLRLAEFGYTSAGEYKYDIVGFPLYPWLVRTCAYVFQDYLISGFIVSGVASIAAGLLLDKLVRLDYRDSIAKASVWFMFIFPTSYFLHINYTESLFIALTLGCFLAARRNRWEIAGFLGVLAGMARVNGLVLIPALIIEAFQQYRETRRWQWQFLWILVMPLGFGFYLLVNKLVTGDWMAFMMANREHFYKWFAPPWAGIRDVIKVIWSNQPEYAQMVGLQEFIFIIIGAVATIVGFRFLRPAYTAWIAGNWLLFTSVGFILGVPRYTLTLFPIFILSARLAEKTFWSNLITIWSLLFLAFFITEFIQGNWAFG